ncbi:radical SAM protein [Candidatus Woesearchaeota archaeon]|nr:radical SAM protein [Candidatus Woesearchaeota archaeon]
MEYNDLIEKADSIFKENFPNTVKFERAIFFSWGCDIRDCAFCYMSTQPKDKKTKEARRSFASIFAECIISKELDWDLGLLSGGIGSMSDDEMEFMMKTICQIYGKKIWLNMGALSEQRLLRFKPYLRGIVGSVETINPVLHKKLCPSKPLVIAERMFAAANKHGIKTVMTFITGMGEVEQDFELLKDFIDKYKIQKIHMYGLNPQKGTIFEGKDPPTVEHQSWWIAKTRIAFPKIDIECGIWENRMDYLPHLLRAGANSVSKLRAMKVFGTDKGRELKREAERFGRKFESEFLSVPEVDWDSKVDVLEVEDKLKQDIKEKIRSYLDNLSS